MVQLFWKVQFFQVKHMLTYDLLIALLYMYPRTMKICTNYLQYLHMVYIFIYFVYSSFIYE